MSLPSTEADVQIILEGQDNASVVIEKASKKINRQYRTMRNEQKALERQFEINNRQFVQAGRVMGNIGSIIGRVRGIYNTFLLQQIRNEQTARNVRDAQKDLNDAIAQFGPSSREAIDANDAVTDALQRQEAQAQQNILIWGFLIGSMIQSVPTILRMIGRMRALLGVTTAVTAATSATAATATASLGAGAGAAAGGAGASAGLGAAAVAGGGAAIGFAAIGIGISEIIKATTDIDEKVAAIQGLNKTSFGRSFQAGVGQSLINIFINAPTTDDMVDEIQQAVRKASTFGQQGS